MPLKILNTKTINGVNQTNLFVAIEDDRLFFTRLAGRTFGLIHDTRVTFINDGALWLFAVDNDPDGFKVSHNSAGNVLIYSQPLVDLMRRSLGIKERTKYYLEQTPSKHNEHPLIEILTKKPVEPVEPKKDIL
jgi:hypothetical protein